MGKSKYSKQKVRAKISIFTVARNLVNKVWKVLVIILTLLGTYYNYSSKVKISSDNSISPRDPFSTPFSILNDSLVNIYSVETHADIKRLATKAGHALSKSTLCGNSSSIDVLRPNEITTFFISSEQIGYSSPISAIDVEIIVSYRPGFLPFRKSINYRFSTVEAPDGTLHWINRASSE